MKYREYRLSSDNLRGLLRFLALRLRYPGRVAGDLVHLGSGAHIVFGRSGQLEIGRGTYVGRDFDAYCGGKLRIGSRVFLNRGVHLSVQQEIDIGDNALLGPYVTIYDNDHRFDDPDLPIRDQGFTVSPVRIGADVLIGAKVTILKGVQIGNRSVIGANSVVTSDVPPGVVAAGSPAHVRRQVVPHPAHADNAARPLL
ncbi:MAG: acyltransferase [Chloroflexi bacterium]|nr:acyltransferase [Chloroflexota bacterium]